MKVKNLESLKELIFNEDVVTIPLGFTYTGSDCYGCYQDLVTKEIYVRHSENSFYKYNSVEETIAEYKELGYLVSFNLLDK